MYDHISALIALCCLIMVVLGCIYEENRSLLLIIGIVGYFVYPFILEPLFSIISLLITNTNENIITTQTKKYFDNKLPLVYSKNYNIKACGLEKLHPFDSCKYEKIHSTITSNSNVDKNKFFTPSFPKRRIISTYHTFSHILLLNYSIYISSCVEVPIFFVPSEFLRYKLLNPMQLATQGSLDSACLALLFGWGINLSGGYHHATCCKGQGFCIYSDITMIVNYTRKWFPNKVRKFLIIDLDAHQGNGYERDLMGDSDVYIIDVFNPDIYPGDQMAKEAINQEIHVNYRDNDEKYLKKVKNGINSSLKEFKPDLVIYNAGTDCLEGDPLGNLNVSPQGIIDRDELVFKNFIEKKIPIVMLMSGGYQKTNGEIIGNSILNLFSKYDLLKSFPNFDDL